MMLENTTMAQDETPEASKATTDPAGVTEEAEEAVARSRGDEAKQKEEGFALCDRLVEESGILQADEIRLEEVRVYSSGIGYSNHL